MRVHGQPSVYDTSTLIYGYGTNDFVFIDSPEGIASAYLWSHPDSSLGFSPGGGGGFGSGGGGGAIPGDDDGSGTGTGDGTGSGGGTPGDTGDVSVPGFADAFGTYYDLLDADPTVGVGRAYDVHPVTSVSGGYDGPVATLGRTTAYRVASATGFPDADYADSLRVYLSDGVRADMDSRLSDGYDALLYAWWDDVQFDPWLGDGAVRLEVVYLPSRSYVVDHRGDEWDVLALSRETVGHVSKWDLLTDYAVGTYHSVVDVGGVPALLACRCAEYDTNDTSTQVRYSVSPDYSLIVYGEGGGGSGTGSGGGGSGTGSGGPGLSGDYDDGVYDANGDTSGLPTEGGSASGSVDLSPVTERQDALNAMVAQVGRDLAAFAHDLDAAFERLFALLGRVYVALTRIDEDLRGLELDVADVAVSVDVTVADEVSALDGLVGDGVADWLGDLLGGLGELGGLLDDLRGKFPFSLPWDLIAIAGLLAHDPVTPAFDVPLPAPGGGDPWVVSVDLAPLDTVAAAVRAAELVLFATALVMRTRDMVSAGEV